MTIRATSKGDKASVYYIYTTFNLPYSFHFPPLSPLLSPSKMGLQPRKTLSKGDTESLLPLSQAEHDDEDDSKDRGRKPAIKLAFTSTWPGLALLALLTVFITRPDLNFPFPPSHPPKPLPSFVKEGIEQCKLISRPPPHFTPFKGDRKANDRFVKGTRPVLLKNGTVWTGEKQGEEVLEGYDILLEKGVVRKISRSGEIALDLKEVDEVELHGAWVTPGMSTLLDTVVVSNLHPADTRDRRHALAFGSRRGPRASWK